VQSKGFKRLFAAENPEKLEAVLDIRKRRLKTILPQLSSLYFNLEDNQAFIKHYRGLAGVKRIYDDLLKELKPGDYYLVISDQQKWMSHDQNYFERFKRERAKLKLKIRLLLRDSAQVRKNKQIQQIYNEQIKIFPEHYELATNMVIVPHKVIVVQTVAPIMALVIENSSLIQMNRVLFDMIWESIG
jgi:hypothetical protein